MASCLKIILIVAYHYIGKDAFPLKLKDFLKQVSLKHGCSVNKLSLKKPLLKT